MADCFADFRTDVAVARATIAQGPWAYGPTPDFIGTDHNGWAVYDAGTSAGELVIALTLLVANGTIHMDTKYKVCTDDAGRHTIHIG